MIIPSKYKGRFEPYCLNTRLKYEATETQLQIRDILNEIVQILDNPVSETEIFYRKYTTQFSNIIIADPSLADDLDSLIKDKMKNGFA